ncbi:MAG: hypothetical protein HY292_01335 [Planctomycetes bacterium]|nr:hypothetical protein [Planctomycetota bacterium]
MIRFPASPHATSRYVIAASTERPARPSLPAADASIDPTTHKPDAGPDLVRGKQSEARGVDSLPVQGKHPVRSRTF